MIEMTIEVRRGFSVLDAAVERCLLRDSRYLGTERRNIVEFQRELITSGSVVYKITEKDPGDLGSLEVYELGADLCAIKIDGPERSMTRGPTEELARIRNIADKEERFKAYADLGKKVRQDQDELHRKRRDLQRVIISAFLSKLRREGILPEVMTHTTGGVAQPEAEDAPTPEAEEWQDSDTAKRDAHIRELFYSPRMYWQIANEVGCSESTVKRTLKEMGLRRRKPRKKQ